MSGQNASRRQFLAAAGVLVTSSLGTAEAATESCRRRWRATAPGRSMQALSRAAIRVRQDVAQLTDQQVASLQSGVAAMKARPVSDPRSWRFQANMHWTVDPVTNQLWNQCEHGTLFFLAWHRGFVYYFERILRDAAQDPGLCLPYWDWTTAPTLPEPFRNPASADNPLYDASRNINDGSALPSEVVVDDLNTAMDLVPFPPSGPTGFTRSVEDSPHGSVHVLTGGTMSSVPTAANDPIFWLHHCNIDRLWDKWLNLNQGRVNPSDPSYLAKQYSFVDETGSTITQTVADIISSAQLGYRYDNVPTPPPSALALVRPRALVVQAGAQKHILAASSLKEEPLTAPVSKPLGFKPETIELHPAAQHASLLGPALKEARTARPGKILLQVEGLSFAETPNFTYAVYLNLPQGESRPEVLKQHYVGTINFFGKKQPPGKQQHDQHAGMTATQTFDVTKVIARLQQTARWKAGDLNVTLRPLTVIATKGSEEDLRRRSEKSALGAKITYQRLNLLVAQ